MIEKFAFIAFLCVSLVQADGNGMEEAIKTALNGMQIMYNNGQTQISSASEQIAYKSKAVQKKTGELVTKSLADQKKTIQDLREVAKAMEQKARETNKPESVFDCIKRNEEKANYQIQTLSDKFKEEITSLESITFINIKMKSKSLIEKRTELKEKYGTIVFLIKNSGTLTDLNCAVKNFDKWLNQMKANIKQILTEVGNIISEHDRVAQNLLRNQMNQIIRVKSEGISDIRKCVFPESNIKFVIE